MKTLTKAEEFVMQTFWKIQEGFVKDIIKHFPDPKPAYNTVSTVVRVLVKKGFVGYKAYGNTHLYYPLVSKEEYINNYFGKFIKEYFNNSFTNIVHFFSKQNKLKLSEVDEIIKMLNQQKKEKKNNE